MLFHVMLLDLKNDAHLGYHTRNHHKILLGRIFTNESAASFT